MNISLIGGSGFIGTRLASRLLKGNHHLDIIDKVVSFEYPEITNLADVRIIDQLGAVISDSSVLINLAAEHRDDVTPTSLYDEVNVYGAKNICSVARQKNIDTIIFTSSVAVYGFAPLGTGEDGTISPFNNYGRTKFEAENIFKQWQMEDPHHRTLVIVRPTVVFGEKNRGNVYNLLRQICSKKFLMIGAGKNRKSMAYVENLAAFLEYSLNFQRGIHIFNYVDKPDFSMNDLVSYVQVLLGKSPKIYIRIPYSFGILIGYWFDLFAKILNKKFPISSIRIKKFCSNSVYSTAIDKTDFIAPISLLNAIGNTVRYEFLENHADERVFYTE